jgi:ParB-like chromosome segregation protein Spo0J
MSPAAPRQKKAPAPPAVSPEAAAAGIPDALKGRRMAFEMMSPKRCKPNPDNPRRIDDDNRERLKAGITQLGWVDPIILRAESRVILGGHQRHDIAMELKFPKVPVVLVYGLSDSEAEAVTIILNNPAAQGEWDLDKLTASLGRLRDQEFPLELTGFDRAAADKMLAGVPALAPPTSLDPGDGRYREQYGVIVICADATEQEAIYNRLQQDGLDCRVVVT